MECVLAIPISLYNENRQNVSYYILTLHRRYAQQPRRKIHVTFYYKNVERPLLVPAMQ